MSGHKGDIAVGGSVREAFLVFRQGAIHSLEIGYTKGSTSKTRAYLWDAVPGQPPTILLTLLARKFVGNDATIL